MNAPLRRAGVVVLILFGLLFVNLNWVQGYKAQSYRTDPHNARVQLSEYQRQRGSIAVSKGQVIVAQSVPTDDELKYQRTYPLGAAYEPIIGYVPVSGLATGVERAENDFLTGNAPELFAESLLALDQALATILGTDEPRTASAAYAELEQRFHRALNNASLLCLTRGNLRGAAGYHAWCLMNGGWRYAPYTRKIVAAGWRRLVAGAAVAPVAGRVD